jgi:hypothetical protein
MSSELVRFVSAVAEKKKIHLTSFGKQRIAAIARKMSSHGSKITVKEVMSELEKEDNLRLGLDRHDWDKIESEVEDSLK